MIATFIQQTRPQSFRHGKPHRYPQRSLTTSVKTSKPHVQVHQKTEWQAHPLSPTKPSQSSKSRLERLRTDSEPRPFSSFLTDNYAREHNYLRISLTERCNLRCLYCMPEEGVPLSPPDHILTTPEIVYLSSLFVNQGVNKIRLTGGEPTVRKDILDLMRQIGNLRKDGLKELCLTTNGISLHRKLDSMVDSGLTGVNLSLDTLDPFQFTIMTRRNGHEAVMKSIERILQMNKVGAGIKLKINCVVMRGLNEKEIIPFVEMGKDKDIEVRFIEYMPFDGNKWSQNKMISYKEMLALIRQKYPDLCKIQDHQNDTSKTYQIPHFTGKIGFITSMTHNFCGTCNRLRITSDGNLKVCLFGNSEVSLRDILRESNNGRPIDEAAMEAIKQIESDRQQALPGSTGALGLSEREAQLLDVIGMAVKRKKEKHAGMGQLENMKNRPMILIDNHSCAQSNYPAYQFNPTLRAASPLSSVRSSSIFAKSIPVHILPISNHVPILQQHRYISTLLHRRTYITKKPFIRYLISQSTHRRIPSGSTSNPHSKESIASHANSKLSVRIAASSIRQKRLSTAKARGSKTHDSSLSSGPQLTHLKSDGSAHMVNIGHKKESDRSATAISTLLFSHHNTYKVLSEARLQKGDALAVARIAGIQAAKKTPDLIPLAHPGLGITAVAVDITPFAAPSNTTRDSASRSDDPTPHSPFGGVHVTATVECQGKTGIEMEALTATTVATLTMYDMLKGVDKGMSINNARVVAKSGGKSGSWVWNEKTRRIEKLTSSITPLANSVNPSSRSTTPEQTHVHTLTPTPTSTAQNSTTDLPSSSPFPSPPSTNEDTTETAQKAFASEWAEFSSSFDHQATSPTTTPTTTPTIPPNPDPAIPTTNSNSNSNSNTTAEASASAETTNASARDSSSGSISSSGGNGLISRDMLSGKAYLKPDASDFHKSRVARYEEWRRSR